MKEYIAIIHNHWITPISGSKKSKHTHYALRHFMCPKDVTPSTYYLREIDKSSELLAVIPAEEFHGEIGLSGYPVDLRVYFRQIEQFVEMYKDKPIGNDPLVESIFIPNECNEKDKFVIGAFACLFELVGTYTPTNDGKGWMLTFRKAGQ